MARNWFCVSRTTMCANNIMSICWRTMANIVKLKYLPKKDFEAKAAEQWQQAVEQIDGYARAPGWKRCVKARSCTRL